MDRQDKDCKNERKKEDVLVKGEIVQVRRIGLVKQ